MKKNLNIFLNVVILSSTIIFVSCDQFENIFLNLPISKEITASGTGPDIFESETICFTDYDSFNDNADDIEQIKYITSAFFTINATSGLQGTGIIATLYRGDGITPLFTFTMPSAVADDYKNNPLKLTLNQQQIDLLNNYLANYKTNNCFVAELRVANVTGTSGPPYSITGKFEMVVELKLKL